MRAVATSWLAVLANAAVGFALTPYILHRIGDEAFGLWVLITSLVGYYGFLDIGIRSSILRYVARYKALEDQERVNEVVSTAFYYYLGACALLTVTTFLTVGRIAGFFSVSAQLLGPFKELFLLAGLVQGVTLPLVVFAAALEAAGRYDQAYLTTIVGLGLRAIAVVWVLGLGGGLFAVGAVTILSQLLVYAIQVPLAFRSHPDLSISPKWIRRRVMRDMIGYGSVSLTVGIAERLRGYIYPVLIAKFLTPMDVTVFSLPMRLMSFPQQGVGTMTEFVNPLSSQLEARNDFARLRQLSLLSVQGAFLTLLPLSAVLFVFGRELLTLWVGARYASAYPLLVLVTLGMGAAATQCCAQSMLFGIERHKALIGYRMLEGLSVALLGSFALRIWGLKGFAAVLAAVLLLTSLVLVPRHLCRVLGSSLRQYLVEGCWKPCIVALPTVATLMLWRHWFPVGSWIDMLAVALVGAMVYALTLLLVATFSSQKWLRLEVLSIVVQRLLPARGSSGLASATVLPSEESSQD